MTAFPDAPFDGVTRLDLDATPLAVVRREGVRMSDLREVFDAGFGALARAVSSGALAPTGPAVAIYHGDPRETFDVEIGFPVAEPLAASIADGDGPAISGSALPAGPAFASTLIGSFEGLSAAWPRLASAAVEAGAEPSGSWIEVYVSDPSSTPQDELRTDLLLPVSIV